MSNADRTFEVRAMKVLQLECLGPPESDWNQQSFFVSTGIILIKLLVQTSHHVVISSTSCMPYVHEYERMKVSNIGCIGGRKLPTEDEYQSKESILFKDITVSRRHFEITPRTSPSGQQQFFIRDLGSAGGTFIRIPHGVRKQLLPGNTFPTFPIV